MDRLPENVVQIDTLNSNYHNFLKRMGKSTPLEIDMIDENELEYTGDLLTENDWDSFFKSKNTEVLFQQNVFGVKNTLLKEGSPVSLFSHQSFQNLAFPI